MRTFRSRSLRTTALCACVLLVGACTLPRSGPTKNEIFAGAAQRQGGSFVVTVDDEVARLSNVTPALGFSSGFLTAGALGSDTINPGDTLGLVVYENVDDGLLGSAAVGPASLDQIQVDGGGFIFVPYAGRIRAAGNTPEAVRRIITEKLEAQTPDPQVIVRRLAGDGATVSLIGGIGRQGVYPIERPTRTLTAMLAEAGGITFPPEITQVSVTRGNHTGRIWLEDLYQNPTLDIALRAGDRILVEEDERFYVTLGATGTQTKVPFNQRMLSAIEAVAQVGGLDPNQADPTGIFVFRTESADVANAVMGRSDLIGPQRVVYVLNLTQPNGIFTARDFNIRSADTVYITTAPFTQFNKAISTIVQPLAPAAAINSLVN